MSKIPRAYTYNDIANKSFNVFPFTGIWGEHQGKPERAGSILIYGDSGHGKTTYALQLLKYICRFEKAFYNSVEEGMRDSFKTNLKINGLKSVSHLYTFQSEFYDTTYQRLDRKRQPKIVFIDSAQYFFRGKTELDYFKLIQKFSNTLFIWISHIQGNAPKGSIADAIKWDAQNIIRVEDFKAYTEKSRCGGSEITPYIISQEKADERELKLVKTQS